MGKPKPYSDYNPKINVLENIATEKSFLGPSLSYVIITREGGRYVCTAFGYYRVDATQKN